MGGVHLNDKTRKIGIVMAAILGLAALLYLGGLLGQLMENYAAWQNEGGMAGQATIASVNWNPAACYRSAFSLSGLKGIGILLLVGGAVTAYVKLHDRFGGKNMDPRGFTLSKDGTYGTASWMDDKELKEVLEVKSLSQADSIILGERKGCAVCLPINTRLNRHIAVFGASGTMKSRGVIRPALFNIIKRGESAIITDSKAELYADTAELFRKTGMRLRCSTWSIHSMVIPGTVCPTWAGIRSSPKC